VRCGQGKISEIRNDGTGRIETDLWVLPLYFARRKSQGKLSIGEQVKFIFNFNYNNCKFRAIEIKS
jgi:hypothetical protein